MPSRIKGTFANPEKKPLSELIINVLDEDVTSYNVPALDKRWAVRDRFTKYESLVMSGARLKTGVELQEWLHTAKRVHEDMTYLLTRQHHEFWSYMVFQRSALQAVISVLQYATPFYIDLSSQGLIAEVLETYEELINMAVRIVYRIATKKESPVAWITNDQLSSLVYGYYLISVPMLFDLAVTLGNASSQNKMLLRGIFDTVLQIEPNYKKDLEEALLFFRTAFSSIQTQTENEGFEGAGGGTLDDEADTPYDDVALFTLDCSYTLSVLLDVCPVVRSICVDIKLAQSIASFYDTTIPLLYRNIFVISENARSLRWLNEARLQFLHAFHKLATSFVEGAQSRPAQSLVSAEMFVALLTECLSEQLFVVDYQHAYPVEKDMKILQDLCKDLDTFKASFVMHAYQTEAEAAASNMIGSIQGISQNRSKSPTEENASLVLKPYNNGNYEPPTITSVPRDIDAEVNAVLEVLSHLGTGFIRRVLSRYESSEEAIAAILEENLPPDLVQADQSEEYIPRDIQDKLYEETGIQHFNVHDGDAYDVMTQDNPSCIIKRGKGFPSAAQNATELLDDKRDLEAIRHRFQEFTLVSECAEDDEYQDEYDDSYDALLESERRPIIPKELKAVLANIADISESESEAENSAEEASNADDLTTGRDKNRNFCEDPAAMRARYEARRVAKLSKRGADSGGGYKSRDVVGAPKGEGQDKETQRNRNYKASHKSSRANHSRKAGAAFKRSKGMIS